jgi:hypothetical protein
VHRLDEIEPSRCREWVRERFDVVPVVDAHDRAYERVLATG